MLSQWYSIHVYIHIYIYVCVCVCICIYTIYRCVCVCIYIVCDTYIYICDVYVCVCMCVWTFTCTKGNVEWKCVPIHLNCWQRKARPLRSLRTTSGRRLKHPPISSEYASIVTATTDSNTLKATISYQDQTKASPKLDETTVSIPQQILSSTFLAQVDCETPKMMKFHHIPGPWRCLWRSSPPGQVQGMYGLFLSHWGLSSGLFDTPTPLSALLPGCPLSARFRSHSPFQRHLDAIKRWLLGYSSIRLEWQAFSKPDQFYTETMPKKNMCHPNVAGFVQ